MCRSGETMAESLGSAIRSAEAYFDKHKLGPLLGRVLNRLAQEQPDDALAALQRFIAAEVSAAAPTLHLSAAADAASSGPAPGEVDVDTPPDEGYDALQLLLSEKLPSQRSATQPADDVSKHKRWAGGVNSALLEGWLPQPSPCCGAASTAGAFNALWDFRRSNEQSASIREVADVMALHCDKLRLQRQERVERLLSLQEGDLGCLLSVLDAELLKRGFDWTSGSDTKVVTRSAFVDTLTEVLRAPEAPVVEDAQSLEGVARAFKALKDAWGEGTVDQAVDAAGDEATGNESLIISTGPDWKQEIGELFSKRKAVFRLRAEKPNTSEVGSWGVKQAAEDLVASRGCDAIRVHVLLGRKAGLKTEVTIEKNDDDAAIDRQWNALKAAFDKPRSVLLFHLTNHYALVYAWREWHEELPDGTLQSHRQILTARKGQRPTAWLEFTECRSIMLGWSGYQMLQIQRVIQ